MPTLVYNFVKESNKIEGIYREPTSSEVEATANFLYLPRPTVEALEVLVQVYAPNAKLRDHKGMDVRVGGYSPPPGGPKILPDLELILKVAGETPECAKEIHLDYERLHPFTDGNGRSGRTLWLWMMCGFSGFPHLGFLHTWYYQTLR